MSYLGSLSSIVMWGNTSVAATAGTRFLDPWWSRNAAQVTNDKRVVVPRAGRLQDMFVRHNAAAGNGNDVVYTLMVNNVPTALAVTLASGAIGQASNLAVVVAVAQGDTISMRATKALGIGAGGVQPIVSLGFT